jgi:AraC-like DNA-binding protein
MLSARLDVTLWRVQTAPYRSLDIRGMVYPQWIASHVLQGEVITETAGVRSSVYTGDVMIHPPDIPFAESAMGAGVHQWFLFTASDPETPALGLFHRYRLPPVLPLGRFRPTYITLFEQLEQEWNRPPTPFQALNASAIAVQLLTLLWEAWQDSGLPEREGVLHRGQERFAEILAFMERNLTERVSRDDLAKKAFLHPGSFDRAFRAVYGVPPMRMLQEMRLNRSKHLLETTGETLESIGRACGMGDAPRFSRLFRARFGVAPGAYRERVKQTKQSYIPLLSVDSAPLTMVASITEE